MENRKIIQAPPTQKQSSSSSLTYHFKSANSSPNSSVDRLQVSLVIWKLVHITMFEKIQKCLIFIGLWGHRGHLNEIGLSSLWGQWGQFPKEDFDETFCSFQTLCMDFTSAWNCFLKWQHAKQNFVQAPLKLTQPFCIIFWLQKYSLKFSFYDHFLTIFAFFCRIGVYLEAQEFTYLVPLANAYGLQEPPIRGQLQRLVQVKMGSLPVLPDHVDFRGVVTITCMNVMDTEIQKTLHLPFIILLDLYPRIQVCIFNMYCAV